ncbi:MAG TPA: hypothetical protein VLF42_11000 [Burkholderiales bacterium]|nr:hypothetical protein [Burkholderiales bacterium]
MNLRIIRRVSISLIATLMFAQASVALAACSMDRGSLAPMLGMSSDCGDCANRCITHCTADLQLPGSLAALVVHPADAPVLLLARADADRVPRAADPVSPPGAVPLRILLHCFLI